MNRNHKNSDPMYTYKQTGNLTMKNASFIALIAVCPISSVNAQPYEIEQSVIAGGGSTSSGGSYSVSGTIGQHDAGGPLAGGTYQLSGGFWAGGNTPVSRLCADQNGDGSVTPTDFTAWISNFNSNDLMADVNQDGAVTPTDFTAWIGAFNQGTNGPVCSP
jgi:hypothetical protein